MQTTPGSILKTIQCNSDKVQKGQAKNSIYRRKTKGACFKKNHLCQMQSSHKPLQWLVDSRSKDWLAVILGPAISVPFATCYAALICSDASLRNHFPMVLQYLSRDFWSVFEGKRFGKSQMSWQYCFVIPASSGAILVINLILLSKTRD